MPLTSEPELLTKASLGNNTAIPDFSVRELIADAIFCSHVVKGGGVAGNGASGALSVELYEFNVYVFCYQTNFLSLWKMILPLSVRMYSGGCMRAYVCSSLLATAPALFDLSGQATTNFVK